MHAAPPANMKEDGGSYRLPGLFPLDSGRMQKVIISPEICKTGVDFLPEKSD